MIKIASFNVENLFERPKAFSPTDLDVARPVLDAHREVNELIKKPVYTDADKARIRDLLVVLDIYYVNSQGAVRRRDSQNPEWAWLRKNRGDFDRQPQDATQNVEITADGRGSWIGWVELAKEPTNEIGTRMTARVIQEINADILAVIEAEDRPSLVRFNQELLGGQYRHIMLIDGNDDRGIDVAIMTRPGFAIERIRSNVDASDAQGEIFSRDCPQYEIRTPGGKAFHVLVNHFKSQSGGGGAKRLRQAKKVREIVDGLSQQGKRVVVLGDLNEGPPAAGSQAPNLAPLFDNNSPLVDCYSLAGIRRRRAAGLVRFVRPAQPARLHLPLERPEAVVPAGGAVPQGTLGRPENASHRLGHLPGNDAVGGAGLRPRRDLRGAQYLSR